jgi:hypothetical protein
VSKPKKPTKAQLLYAAQAVFEARVIVERHLQQPEGSLDAKLRELEMSYYRHADAERRGGNERG